MNPTEAELKLAIATIESVEQHLNIVRKAIAHDAVSQEENYRHVFMAMIDEAIKLIQASWEKSLC